LFTLKKRNKLRSS